MKINILLFTLLFSVVAYAKSTISLSPEKQKMSVKAFSVAYKCFFGEEVHK